ncbi:Histidine kinase-, DNA gyrase B-, and HSP90-like ATPase [Rhizobiales bacterium GAS188]|nr:Histidine kinase-, DNA gyrase B-, and HSP90-like ATPase [Rhizobiales bacterium GAS188]
MLDNLLGYGQRQRSTAADDLTRRWASGIGFAAAIGSAYSLVAYVSGLLVVPEGVAVFWPAAGISSGILIAVGSLARWPVAAGVTVGTLAMHLIQGDPLPVGAALGLCNAAEALIVAGLITRYFGDGFSLERLRHVLGLLAAAVAGTVVSGVGGAITYGLWRGAPFLTTWQAWFASDVIGVVIVAPLVIGLTAALREPLPGSELLEGAAALVGLALVTMIIISLPPEPWATVVPGALLFPMLLLLAARYRPVMASAGAFMVSFTVVLTTIFGIGHFGDARIPIEDRILQAQAVIVIVALFALVLAALFAGRRESEARLTRSNTMLQRERDNKLMNMQALTAAIAHQVRQPLGVIQANSNAAMNFLSRAPPDLEEIRAALTDVIGANRRVSEVFDSIRTLFGKVDQGRQPIDLNEVILRALHSMRGELKDHDVETRPELTSGLPLVDGHAGQLQEVIINLVQNALEAMDATSDRSRVLRIGTERRGRDAVVVAVEDSGPGVDPKQLDNIFTAFVTTKTHGMGLGLAICRMIIEDHAGQLTASSDGKNGTLFQFVVPIGLRDG